MGVVTIRMLKFIAFIIPRHAKFRFVQEHPIISNDPADLIADQGYVLKCGAETTRLLSGWGFVRTEDLRKF